MSRAPGNYSFRNLEIVGTRSEAQLRRPSPDTYEGRRLDHGTQNRSTAAASPTTTNSSQKHAGLSSEPQYQVVSIVTDGRALLEAAFTPERPDVILLDIAMPGLNGLDAAEQIKHKTPSVKLVFMTMTQTPEVVAAAFRRGASGYVLKQSAAEELIAAIRRVLRSEPTSRH